MKTEFTVLMDVLIKGVKLIGVDGHTTDHPCDILISGGIVADIAANIEKPDCRLIDGTDLCASAGFVDMHAHLRDPGFTHKEDILSGGEAAAAGGITHIACMPNTKPVCDSAETLEYILQKAANCKAHVHPIAAVTAGQKGETLTDFEALAAAGAVAFSDDGMPVMRGEMTREALIKAAAIHKTVISHCEDLDFKAPKLADDYGLTGYNIPVETDEEAMAARDIFIAKETGTAVHIAHVSTKNSVDIIRRAKSEGIRVTCETCPHYLLLTNEATARSGANAKMNPPLRSERDRLAIIEAVCDGTVDALVTDHAPHSAEEKAVGFDKAPNGIVGFETLFAGVIHVLRGKLPLEKIIEKLTIVPARILGINAGRLYVGGPADLTLFDPDERWTVKAADFRSKSRNTPFDGMELTGRVKYTICRGEIVFDGCER